MKRNKNDSNLIEPDEMEAKQYHHGENSRKRVQSRWVRCRRRWAPRAPPRRVRRPKRGAWWWRRRPAAPTSRTRRRRCRCAPAPACWASCGSRASSAAASAPSHKSDHSETKNKKNQPNIRSCGSATTSDAFRGFLFIQFSWIFADWSTLMEGNIVSLVLDQSPESR